MTFSDTIVAISSAVGPAPRMIVRMSGRSAREIYYQICLEERPSPVGTRPLPEYQERVHNSATRTVLQFNELNIPAWVYQFHAPRSYTGEDVVEFHLPGNPLLVRMLMDELVRLGARPAEAGEFTARAYFAGKLDLTEAEGVAIKSGSRLIASK